MSRGVRAAASSARSSNQSAAEDHGAPAFPGHRQNGEADDRRRASISASRRSRARHTGRPNWALSRPTSSPPTERLLRRERSSSERSAQELGARHVSPVRASAQHQPQADAKNLPRPERGSNERQLSVQSERPPQEQPVRGSAQHQPQADAKNLPRPERGRNERRLSDRRRTLATGRALRKAH